MRTDQTHEESTKDWVDSDDTSEKGRGKYHEDGQSHHGLSGAIVKATTPPQKPQEGWADGVDKEQDVADARKEDVQSGNPGTGVDNGDAQS